MAHKTFISYKYSEAVELRDKIIEALGPDSQFYKGETSDSPDISDNKTDSIKKTLKDMIWGTSVTIVIASPNMKESQWIDWEIEYSLKQISRDGKTSKTNGIVVVVMQDENDSYDWLITTQKKSDGCYALSYDLDKLLPIINQNRYNKKNKKYACKECKTYNALTASYISIVKEKDFLDDPQKYIDNAYNKSQNLDDFDIVKEIK